MEEKKPDKIIDKTGKEFKAVKFTDTKRPKGNFGKTGGTLF